MRNITHTIFAAALLSSMSCYAKEFHVYILAGQSNMTGYGMTAELEETERNPVDGVMIFEGANEKDNKVGRGGNGKWETLAPGHGNWKKCFGPELFFGKRIQELYPERNIALIKYARIGSSIAVDAAGHWGCWHPVYEKNNGVNQWDHFLATMKNARAVKDIDGDGTEDKLIPAGITWMQGESDACKTEEIARAYSANLKVLMDSMRKELGSEVPVAIAYISNSKDAKAKGLTVKGNGMTWRHSAIVRSQQEDFVKKDGNAALITSTDNYGYFDNAHYDAAGQKDLGIQFAEALNKIDKNEN